MSKAVLDASALLAYLYDEPGASVVEEVLARGAYISALNWAEVLSKTAELGEDPEALAVQLEQQGLLKQGLIVWPLTAEDAVLIAKINISTKEYPLSMGDRACISLAQRLSLPLLTANPTWQDLALPVKVQAIC